MRSITTALTVLLVFFLSACGKTDYEKRAEKDADAQRAVNTAPK
jgi:uncharacterized lipoprotein